MTQEIRDELRRTLQQICPAHFSEVASDIRGRVRLGLLMFVAEPDDLEATLAEGWRELIADQAIQHVGDGTYRWRPAAATASGPGQRRLFR